MSVIEGGLKALPRLNLLLDQGESSRVFPSTVPCSSNSYNTIASVLGHILRAQAHFSSSSSPFSIYLLRLAVFFHYRNSNK
jgi:hypothetical protein